MKFPIYENFLKSLLLGVSIIVNSSYEGFVGITKDLSSPKSSLERRDNSEANS